MDGTQNFTSRTFNLTLEEFVYFLRCMFTFSRPKEIAHANEEFEFAMFRVNGLYFGEQISNGADSRPDRQSRETCINILGETINRPSSHFNWSRCWCRRGGGHEVRKTRLVSCFLALLTLHH